MSRSFEPKHLSKLTPPGSTSYWRRQRFTPMIDKKILHVEAGEDVVLEILTWRIDAYVYVIDAKPDSDFSGNGGSVYVVLLHSGSAVVQDAITEHELRWVVTCRSAGQQAPAIMQLPASHSGTTNGNVTSYPIAFAQDMQMFRNDGNEVFTFPAQHEDRVDISVGKLSGDIVNSSKVQWGIAYADGKEASSNLQPPSVHQRLAP
ncbi:hypothetical protein ONZ45_g9558 [Pleurotus djamor]|nr:hypothetical protein ONZ45_g9558 [Pleurotus djamor]